MSNISKDPNVKQWQRKQDAAAAREAAYSKRESVILKSILGLRDNQSRARSPKAQLFPYL